MGLGTRRRDQPPRWAQDPLWTAARAVPSLDLRFAANRSPRDAVTGRELVMTFTRASNATVVGPTGLIETVANDVPRFQHDPTTGACLGLLVEEQRANLLLRSEEFGTTWIPANLTVTSDSTTAPSGILTADRLVEDSSLGTHVLQQSASVVNGTAYTLSCYAKPAGRNFAQLLLLGGFATNITAIFDITTGVVGTTAGSPVVTSTNVGNGWYRLSITATATSTTAMVVQLRPAGSSSTAFYQGDGTSGIYLWGAQLEAGAFPTSYIKTEGTSATRSADIATITGTAFSGWYNQAQGTMFTDFRRASLIPSAAFANLWAISDGTANERVIVYNTGAVQSLDAVVADGGTGQAFLIPAGSIAANAAIKSAFGYQANNFGFARDNGIVVTDISGTLPTVDRLHLAANQAGTGQWNGTISRLTYWGQRLPNSTLQALTT